MENAEGLSGIADTALVKIPELHKEGFIDANSVCGREDSRLVQVQVRARPHVDSPHRDDVELIVTHCS
jgi:hypothetical protein